MESLESQLFKNHLFLGKVPPPPRGQICVSKIFHIGVRPPLNLSRFVSQRGGGDLPAERVADSWGGGAGSLVEKKKMHREEKMVHEEKNAS